MSGKILVPIDLAHESSWQKALPQGFQMAENQGSDLVLMTVVPEIIAGLDWRYAIRGEQHGSEELDTQQLVEDAKTRLAQIGSEYAPAGMGFEVIARHGTVYAEILDVADEIGADQIVMAAHRPSLADYLIGPNTASVVRHAKCSVTVIRD